MRPQRIALAGVSAFAILIGQGAYGQTADVPVVPLSEIEAAYDGQANASAPQSDLDTLQKAIEEEIQTRGGQPTVALPAPATKDAAIATTGSNVPRSAAAASSGSTQASLRTGVPATSKVDSAVELPTVPSNVVVPGVARAPEDLEALTQPAVITIRSGTTELLAVAEGHANRIVTPFAEPAVMTTSDAKFKISGNVVYVSTKSPATIFITPKGDESVAIPLALVPRRIPPREIRLEMPRGGVWNASFSAAAAMGNKKAQSWEESQPYVETLRGIMRDMALGTVPSGYQMRDMDPGEAPTQCAGPVNLTFQFAGGQVMEGSHLQVVVGVVTNRSGSSIELAEPWCAAPNVAAVAYWPHNVLAPGQSTEVFVVRRPTLPSDTDTRRPSLLTKAGAVR